MTCIAPYVGVAAITTPGEAKGLLGMLDCIDWPARVRLMNGPLMSRKTLTGQVPDNPDRYPQAQIIADLMIDDPRIWNVIHFNSRDPWVAAQLHKIVSLSPLIQGIQLNISWPEREELRNFRNQHPDIEIILQVGSGAFGALGYDIPHLIRTIARYEGLVDYVLFDPSGGMGRPFDVEHSHSLLTQLIRSGMQMGWGVTGGLTADSVNRLQSLIDIYPGLSWDAESGLRNNHDGLDARKCHAFLKASAELLR